MNKGAFSYPERFRGESFHGFPSKNKQPLFFGFPSGSEVYDFKCDANTANFAFRITLVAKAGARIVIDKGNGGSITTIGTGGNVNIDWTYPQPGQYNINLSGETSLITSITINSRRLIGNLSQSFVDKIPNIQVFNIATNFISGALPSFASCTALTVFRCNNNQFSGTLPSFANCTALTTFYCYVNQFSGELPSFANCTALMSFLCYINQFSGTLPSFANCTALTTFYCYNNQFSGELPSFANCTALTNFQCYSNQFSGAAPVFNMSIVATQLQMQLNLFTSFEALIDNFYQNRVLRNSVLSVDLSGANNATPSGIFQAPAGYVQADTGVNGNDGTPVSAKEQIFVLVNQNVDTHDGSCSSCWFKRGAGKQCGGPLSRGRADRSVSGRASRNAARRARRRCSGHDAG